MHSSLFMIQEACHNLMSHGAGFGEACPEQWFGRCCSTAATWASNAATNTHTCPTSWFKVSDLLSLSFGVFMSCRRVRVVLPIGSPGVYMGRIVLVRPRSSSLQRQIATLDIAIAYCCHCWYSCCSTLLAGCQLTSAYACAAYACMTTGMTI